MASDRGLPTTALRVLGGGVPVMLLSADARARPHATYSWAVAASARALHVAVDRGGRTSSNWRRHGDVAVQVIGAGGCNLLLTGRARLLSDSLPCATAMEVWRLAISRVVDQSWPGVATSALRYRWPAERRAAMRRFERTVYRQLREAVAADRF